MKLPRIADARENAESESNLGVEFARNGTGLAEFPGVIRGECEIGESLKLDALEIVHLENNDLDSERLGRELRTGGIEAKIVRVQTEDAFRREIERPTVDIILAESGCPGYDGMSALSHAREARPELPFIFLAAQNNHGNAIDPGSVGVTDLVLKKDLPKLVPALRRLLGESRTRKQFDALRGSPDQLDLFKLANDAIILSDADGKIKQWNPGAERIYGWTKDEALGRNVHTLLGTVLTENGDLEAALQESSYWQGELLQTRRDGRQLCLASRWILRSTDSESLRLQINRDITAQKRAEDALRKSEERYRRFVNEDLTGSVVMKPDGRIVMCNRAFARIFGFESVEKAQTANFNSVLRSRNGTEELFDLVRQHTVVDRHELEVLDVNGDPVYVVTRFAGTFDDQHQLTELQGYLFNDTKRKRLEQQLIQAQKMEGLGTLAGGIAHDFNNILAIILGYATRLETAISNPEQISRSIRVIKEAVERGASLVQQLLTSARQTDARFASVDLNEVVRELEGMLRATFPKMITFELRLRPDLPTIAADRSQIHQVLLNLCVNARDAMPNGGSIILKTSLVDGTEVGKHFTGAEAEKYARVRITDTGAGMTREVKSHIFEPFFTTKERRQGTGLGLSVVYGVVNSHRGFVRVESESGSGTTFDIYLPVQQTAPDICGPAAVLAPKPTAAQTILLVEDEEMLRDLGVTILEGEGYHVLAAKDGIDAVETYVRHRDEIGLVVCDLGLPRLGGRDAFMKMKENNPAVRAIVASGYLDPNVRSEMLKTGVIDTIQKPYDFAEMVEKIRSAIGNAKPASE